MGAPQNLPYLNCELRIIRAKNLEFIPAGNLFMRYYLSARNNERVRLNSQEIPSTASPCWNESISLECFGSQDCVEELKQQTVVFELRWRSTAPILGRIGGSKLLGKAEVAWKDVFESPELAIEKWVTTIPESRRRRSLLQGLKPPALQIGMKVRIPEAKEMVKRKMDARSTRWSECGCKHGGCNGGDDDIFALAAALEAL
ncbi:PREDICTED: uncharacterized protein LOC104605185 [Nelumbo nucifera]|uniref:C2 domain-containing protein n=2 Tax=Nelumbo nucifera TaxID=4432 RepID=A0A822Z7V1_NELNU|nr:PREDICTED: uncharacterized protein LOC104605185 [Nelumbo nucifera]DAD41152.1 TPA_asm: hypothetical protein HUJ06_015475 [Nelumbo nucifera]